jgi:hypothetical protein
MSGEAQASVREVERKIMMKTWIAAASVAVLVLMTLGTTSKSDGDTKAKRGLFATLRVGQAVNVKDIGPAYEISTFDNDMPLGYTVVEIDTDYIVLRDIAKVSETRIPIYAVKSVSCIRTKIQAGQ